MTRNRLGRRLHRHPILAIGTATLMAVGALGGVPAAQAAQPDSATVLSGASSRLAPGNLLVSTSVYDNKATNVTVGETLPPGCTSGCGTAIANGLYPQVFNNDTVDSSFGITAAIVLDQLSPSGKLISTLNVPTNEVVTSFSSKSEIALNLSTSRKTITAMGYDAPIDTLDVSNSNTPGVIDPTNPVPSAYYRAVAEIASNGKVGVTLSNAYSGNNGRAAILNDSGPSDLLYMSGNAGNGGSPQPDGVILGAGAQIAMPQTLPEAAQKPGLPTPVGSFNITQLGDPSDKIGKDTNFRGLAIFHNVLYYTKGSGGNGVNTVYFLDTTGQACPNGIGVPVAGAPLPTWPLDYNPAVLPTAGLTPTNMCILQGFPTALKSSTFFPFGVWFANAQTLYVAQEGDGVNTFSTTTGTYTDAGAQTVAGLQKWVLVGGTWTLAYTLQSGLSLGVPYTVSGYPLGNNAVTGLPWSPATDGLRNLTGRLNPNGTVSVWAVTSTVSGSGDQGADPNKVVSITDVLSATSPPPATEQFKTIRAAGFGEVVRGVSFAPGS
jgi:hypothetical protein